MAIFERRNDRPAAAARSASEGWRAERSCCFARNAVAWRQGKKIANEPLRAKVGERRERIVASNQPAKEAMVRVETVSQQGMAQVRRSRRGCTALARETISRECNKDKLIETKMQPE